MASDARTRSSVRTITLAETDASELLWEARLMRVYVRTLTLFAALLGGTGALAAQQLREDSYRWYIGPQGGVLLTQT